MIIRMELAKDSYDIVLEPACLSRAASLLELDRRVLIVTDEGVPEAYAKKIAGQSRQPVIVSVPQGEGSKSLRQFEILLETMLREGFTRQDCVVAVGGGVAGDLAGFTAASYMRGVDFYNIPTTVLAQVDSSIGGKTAVNLGGIKNIVGAFYQPKKVLIDRETLRTLDRRQTSNGLAEVVKMALIADAALFELLEKEEIVENMDEVIKRSLLIKKAVVEQDEKEQGLRQILNFGHTIGHGIESAQPGAGLYHGECVALGMIPMCSEAVRERLIPVLQKLSLPTSCAMDTEKVYAALCHDKKAADGQISVVRVESVGSCRLEKVPPQALKDKLALIAEGA